MEAIWPISTLSVISKILAEPRLSASWKQEVFQQVPPVNPGARLSEDT